MATYRRKTLPWARGALNRVRMEMSCAVTIARPPAATKGKGGGAGERPSEGMTRFAPLVLRTAGCPSHRRHRVCAPPPKAGRWGGGVGVGGGGGVRGRPAAGG